MKLFQMKNIPNALGIARITLCIPIIIYAIVGLTSTPKSLIVFTLIPMICYIVAGLTDTADGQFARRVKGAKSEIGETIDSAADMALVITGIAFLMPAMVNGGLWSWLLWAYIIGVSYRIASIVIGTIWHKQSIMLHTYGMKLIAWLLFLTPLVFYFVVIVPGNQDSEFWLNAVNVWTLIVIIIAITFVTEELVITFLLLKPSRNITSIFGIKKENEKIRAEMVLSSTENTVETETNVKTE